MAYFKTLQCILCGERFKWAHEGFPDECPCCGQYIGLDGKPEVAAPHIALKIGKSADNVYRAMENGADHRAEVAADILNIPKAELTDSKITNMRDNVRAGENSAPKLSSSANEIMQWMERQKGPALPPNIVPMAYGQPNPVQQTLKQTPQLIRTDPMAHRELGHPKSGAGSGLRALYELKASRFSR